jgi:hypothetical protein
MHFLPDINKTRAKQFPASVKQMITKAFSCGRIRINMPDGITAHLTRECGGNVHDYHIVEVASGSFENETNGANPSSGAFGNKPNCITKNAADLETDSPFSSAHCNPWEAIPHIKDNWVFCDFKESRIVPISTQSARVVMAWAGGV